MATPNWKPTFDAEEERRLFNFIPKSVLWLLLINRLGINELCIRWTNLYRCGDCPQKPPREFWRRD